MSGGTLGISAECPGGHWALVQNVRGDILHGGTIHPPHTGLKHIKIIITRYNNMPYTRLYTAIRTMKHAQYATAVQVSHIWWDLIVIQLKWYKQELLTAIWIHSRGKVTTG